MNSLFGISTTDLMIALLIILGLCLAALAVIALRQPLVMKLGLRNIPRRPAQTSLIVLGLMLGTLIISASFTLGDTLSYSIRNVIYEALGPTDFEVGPGRETGTAGQVAFEQNERSFFAQADAAKLRGQLGSDPKGTPVDGVAPVIESTVPAFNQAAQLGKPAVGLIGIAPQDAETFGGLTDAQSKAKRSLSELGPSEVYLNQNLANKIDAKAGQPLTIYPAGQEMTVTVKAIVENKGLGYGTQTSQTDPSMGIVVPLERAQTWLGKAGQVNRIYVSGQGGADSAEARSDTVRNQIKDALKATGLGGTLAVSANKANGLKAAEDAGASFTSVFVVLGLFSIGAGLLLIFLIFVMLAAERKPEMGMARAVGMKRRHLVESFLAEGLAYDLIAAAIGAGLGVLVSFTMVQVMAAVFQQFGLALVPHVEPRSLIISYCLGVILTFATVTFSAWRVSVLNIVRAIRDIDEPSYVGRRRRPPLRRLIWSLILIPAGVVVGLIGLVLGAVLGQIGLTSLLIVGTIIGGIGLVAAVGGVGAVIWWFLTWPFGAGGPLLLLGLLLIAIGLPLKNAALFNGGISLLPLGLALLLRRCGVAERIAFTFTGVALLVWWLLPQNALDSFLPKMDAGIEMFFVSGVMLVVGSVLVVTYNADWIIAAMVLLARPFGRLVPAIKMGVAYPLASRFRTGLTLAMFALIIFALTVLTTINTSYSSALNDTSRLTGGWDIQAAINPLSPVPDMRAALAQSGKVDLNDINAIAGLSFVPPRTTELARPSDPNATPQRYSIRGVDQEFLANTRYKLQTRAEGYADDAAVFQAMRSDPTLAVIDANAVASGGNFGGPPNESDFRLTGLTQTDKTMKPVEITLRNATSGQTQTIKIVGVVGTLGAFGLYLPQQTVNQVFGQQPTVEYLIQTRPGTDNTTLAKAMESALLRNGLQAVALADFAKQQQQTSNVFLALLQGFMALGLVVGIAALGVIAFRAVVERRQQIGMLRAIGYRKSIVALTFLVESIFVTLTGIVAGVSTGLILSRNLFASAQFGGDVDASSFTVPWPSLLLFVGIALLAALLMTALPARLASRVAPAEALRYE